MKFILRLTFLALLLALGACSTTYTRPDTTEAQMNADLEKCQAEAEREFPGSWTPEGPNYASQNSVGCGTADCRTMPGSSLGESTRDRNKTARDKATIACMEDEGYKL